MKRDVRTRTEWDAAQFGSLHNACDDPRAEDAASLAGEDFTGTGEALPQALEDALERSRRAVAAARDNRCEYCGSETPDGETACARCGWAERYQGEHATQDQETAR